MRNARFLGQEGHRTNTRPPTRRRLAVVASSSAVLASLLYALPAPAASGASTPTLSEYSAGIGPSDGNGAAPQEIAVGPDGNLWYTDDASGVFKFSPKTLRPLPCSSSSTTPGCEVSANAVAPTGIVAGPDGALWFTQSSGGNPGDGRSYFPASIGRITTAGAYSSYAVPASAKKVPDLDAITVGPNGNLWFTETAVNRIGEITPQATGAVIHEFALSAAADRLGQGVGSSVTSADTIAAGPDDDVFFTEQGSNAIGVMNSSGALVSKFTVPNSNLNPTPLGITESPGGTMWFTENAANQVVSYSFGTGRSKAFPLPAGASGPGSIVYGPDGNLWFTDNSGVGDIDPATGKGTLYRAHTAGSGPVGITVGPDCTSIWFTESNADRLGRVSPIPNSTGCKAGVVPGSGTTAPSSNHTYTIQAVKPFKSITIKSSPFFPHGPPHFIVKAALLPSTHPVCLACAAELAQKVKPGASPAQPGPLPPYTEPFVPAAMWAQGPLCGTAGANCSYSDWTAMSGHSIGYDGFPDSSTPSAATPLPSIITSPSPTVQFTVPCYFVWDPADNRPADANGNYYAVGDFLHCDAQIYAATGPVTVEGNPSNVVCPECGVQPGSPVLPEVGSGWVQLATGAVDVGVPGISKIGTGATEIGTVACNQSSTAPPCIIYGKDITLTLFAPGVNATIVFGVHYYEGDDRPGIESSQPGFISAGPGPIRLEGYRYPLAGSVTAETPAVECDQNSARSNGTTCSWQGFNSSETVLCLNSALATCYEPSQPDLGFDMATGPDGFKPADNGVPPYLQGFIDLPSLSIEPTAFVQSDVLVSSILYQPPGAQSVVDYSKKTTNAVQIAVGATSSQGTTNALSDGTTVTYKAGTPDSIGGVPVVGFNFSDASQDGWDTSASATDTTATGASTTWSSSVGDEWSSKPYTPPAPFNQHTAEYWFLGDKFILALYPQWAVWDFMSAPGQGSFVQSLVATGGVQSVTVSSLLQCSGGLTPYNGEPAADITIPAIPNPIVLSSAECGSLLGMDPFASTLPSPGNQWADLSTLESDGRAVSLDDCCSTASNNVTTVQDVDPTSVDKITLSDELNSVDTSSYTAAFASKVTATLGNTWSAGATLPEGLGGATIQQNNSSTSGGDWEIDYKNSLMNSQDSINSGSVTLSDNSNPISTEVYLDTTFGTFMFPAFGAKPPSVQSCFTCVPRLVPPTTTPVPPVK